MKTTRSDEGLALETASFQIFHPFDKTKFSYQTMSLHFGWIIAQFNGLFVVSSFVCSFGTLVFVTENKSERTEVKCS